MTTTEKMNVDERHKYLRIMRQQYRQTQTHRAKQELLDQPQTVTGLHRKDLIRLVRPTALRHHPRQQERGPEYGSDVDTTIAFIWEAQDYSCAKRLQPVLVIIAEQLARLDELQLGPRLRELLRTIHPPQSTATCRHPHTACRPRPVSASRTPPTSRFRSAAFPGIPPKQGIASWIYCITAGCAPWRSTAAPSNSLMLPPGEAPAVPFWAGVIS